MGLWLNHGKIVSGMDAVIESVQKDKTYLVIIAKDTSEKSKENIKYVCTKHKVQVIEFNTMENLGLAIGKKNRAIIGIRDKNFSMRNNREI